jgi:hypothetical protein
VKAVFQGYNTLAIIHSHSVFIAVNSLNDLSFSHVYSLVRRISFSTEQMPLSKHANVVNFRVAGYAQTRAVPHFLIYGRTLDVHLHLCGLPSHVSQGLT